MPLVSRKKFFFLLALATLFVLGADQLIKLEVLRVIEEGEQRTFLGPLQWTLFYNDGIAFGIGERTVATAASLLGMVAFGLLISAAPSISVAAIAAGFVLGGALGNWIDRINHGAVVDFLFLPGTPVFNMADVAIFFGVFVLLLVIISPRYQTKETQ